MKKTDDLIKKWGKITDHFEGDEFPDIPPEDIKETLSMMLENQAKFQASKKQDSGSANTFDTHIHNLITRLTCGDTQ